MKAKETLTRFMEAWKKADYKAMYECCNLSWRDIHGSADDIKNLFDNRELKSYAILKGKEVNTMIGKVIDIKVKCRIYFTDTQELKAVTLPQVRMIQESEAYTVDPTAPWYVNPISVLKMK